MAAPPPHASASLYAGNLTTDVTEAMLFEMFNQVGPVASIRVCRDAVTRRSLGYAYINFHSVVDAERALDTLNYTPVKGKAIRLMWSQRDPSLRKSGVGNIFIKNLDKTIDNKSLHDTFSAFGNILSCKVVTDELGQSRGYGFVHYESSEAADSAISKVDGMLLNGKLVYVGRHVSKKERDSKAEELKKNFTNVFIKNLDENCDDDKIRKMFEEYGEVTSCIVMKGEDGKSRGFGFVNFADHNAAVKGVEALNESELDGRKIFVGRAQKKSERQEELQKRFEAMKLERLNKYQGVNLYVKNLDDVVDDEKLRQEFSAFGTITSAKITRDDKGNSRGFGFVCFTSAEEATRAVTEMNNRMLGSKPIYVALAQRKEVRKQQLEAQHAQRTQMRMQQSGGLVPSPAMYGGAPMFYAPNPVNMPQPARGQGGFVYPHMVPRPRWTTPQQMGGVYPAPSTMSNRTRQSNNRAPRGQQGRPGGVANVLPAQQPGANMMNQQRRTNNYKYNTGVRNVRQDMPQNATAPAIPAATGAAPAVVPAPNQEPLTPGQLAVMPLQAQKQLLGQRLFYQVQMIEKDLAGKITGMLLEMDNTELLHLLESPESLNQKIDEAMQVLHSHKPEEAAATATPNTAAATPTPVPATEEEKKETEAV